MAFTRAQRQSLAVGFGLILFAGTLVALVWWGTYLPGFAGDVFRGIAGFMWSPVLLELTLFFLGVVLILWLNWFIRARQGDEYVYLEQIEGPDVPDDLPAEARSAVFAEAPERDGLAPELAAIEGALELGDTAQAAELLFRLAPERLDSPEVLAVRIQLARAQGRHDKTRELIGKLALSSPRHPLCREEPEPPRAG